MIAYYYPPIASVAVLRTQKFAKYLPRYGWTPIVLTVKNPDPFAAKADPKYANESVVGTEEFKSYSVPIALISRGLERIGINHKWFMIPDHFIGWLPHAYYQGRKILKKERVDAIYVSAPPFTSIILGALLKQETGLPLILDYRDPWTSNQFIKYPTKHHYKLERRIEAWALKKADSVLTVGQDCRESILKTFPFIDPNKIHVIYNGFDPEDLYGLTPWKFNKFTILHAGSIYGQRVQVLQEFLKGCAKLQESRIFDNDFQIVFVGNLASDAKRLIDESNLSKKVLCLGLKPRKETLQLMLGADILLLIPGASSAITAKLFEYLAAGKFILNIGDSLEAAKIIDSEKAGISITPDALCKNSGHLNLSNKQALHVKPESTSRFSRIEMTKKLAAILSQATSG